MDENQKNINSQINQDLAAVLNEQLYINIQKLLIKFKKTQNSYQSLKKHVAAYNRSIKFLNKLSLEEQERQTIKESTQIYSINDLNQLSNWAWDQKVSSSLIKIRKFNKKLLDITKKAHMELMDMRNLLTDEELTYTVYLGNRSNPTLKKITLKEKDFVELLSVQSYYNSDKLHSIDNNFGGASIVLDYNTLSNKIKREKGKKDIQAAKIEIINISKNKKGKQNKTSFEEFVNELLQTKDGDKIKTNKKTGETYKVPNYIYSINDIAEMITEAQSRFFNKSGELKVNTTQKDLKGFIKDWQAMKKFKIDTIHGQASYSTSTLTQYGDVFIQDGITSQVKITGSKDLPAGIRAATVYNAHTKTYQAFTQSQQIDEESILKIYSLKAITEDVAENALWEGRTKAAKTIENKMDFLRSISFKI